MNVPSYWTLISQSLGRPHRTCYTLIASAFSSITLTLPLATSTMTVNSGTGTDSLPTLITYTKRHTPGPGSPWLYLFPRSIIHDALYTVPTSISHSWPSLSGGHGGFSTAASGGRGRGRGRGGGDASATGGRLCGGAREHHLLDHIARVLQPARQVRVAAVLETGGLIIVSSLTNILST